MSSPVHPKLSVQILGFDGVQALDLVGPLEALASVRVAGHPAYDIRLVGLHGRRFSSETGIVFEADSDLSERATADTIIVPGGSGLRRPDTLKAASSWVLAQASSARRIVSVCTGAYALAAAGVLDGRRATTHWRFIADLAQRYPSMDVDPDAIFIKDGPIYTSAGITAGIDLALALAEEDFGPTAALDVAREMVVFLKRPGGQAQFSQPLSMQMRSGDRFADLIAWMAANPGADQCVEVLAAKASMSVRTFSRRFKEQIGRSPARYAEDLRLDAARARLERRHEPISVIAADFGFGSDDAFARVFSRRFGVRPSDYRDRFQTKDET
ncbi:GlxA family transcriptional regulator [Brevundimonas naejangsanensis]|uniref:GlxA family transcriptional regulator n=1 Tax=Brevundimonas naejangsanensis TaxID=588932 RepID=A0A494RKK9_9CAUL|nr:GlxA family transcriptional regulator [Brevundimonas naejangsanensis]AYG96009.1 GlxA family transcriptional regulator [Brevundimonas naejangsanensis]